MNAHEPRLSGKRAVVTGGSRGLGRAIARAFATEGADLVIGYRNDSRAAAEVVAGIEADGRKALAIRADVRDAPAVEGMIDAAIDALGAIDILVNNAGLLNSAPLVEMSVETWDEMIATHLRGCFLCTRYAVPHMLERGGGKIINMGGSFGVQGVANFAHLSAAKAGMIGFTQALARELGPSKILVNVIAPAMIRTELVENLPPGALEQAAERYPLRRIGDVDDVVATALFLASRDGDFFTGQTLCPAGGDVMV